MGLDIKHCTHTHHIRTPLTCGVTPTRAIPYPRPRRISPPPVKLPSMLGSTGTAVGRIAALSGPKQQALSSLSIKTTSVGLAIDCTVCRGSVMLSIC